MPPPRERTTLDVRAERAVLAAVRLPDSAHDPSDPFGELSALAEQAGATPVAVIEQFRDRPEAGTFMGSGKIEELKGLCAQVDADVVIFDHELSPKQIAAIETAVDRKIIDRSELILDIFASRATTHEAKLQVELAQLEYTYPRLRAMWSHLERITAGSPGGVGTRGPGEQQLEIDRRIVQRKKVLLKRELDEIQARKRRSVERRNTEHYTIGLVGYTNAGKSTLFNTMTAGGAYADDRLFATLMTRTRSWALGNGEEAMLSDTVGFVRDLPHNLVASFKATLEEATHADLLLVVIDIADPAAVRHLETVDSVLDDLFDDVERTERKHEAKATRDGGTLDQSKRWRRPIRQLVLNKADKLSDNAVLLEWQQRHPGAIAVSSLPPKLDEHGTPLSPRPLGQDTLIERVRLGMRGTERRCTVTIGLNQGKAINTLETRGVVHDRAYVGNAVALDVTIGERVLDRLRTMGARFEVVDSDHDADAPAFASDSTPRPSAGWNS